MIDPMRELQEQRWAEFQRREWEALAAATSPQFATWALCIPSKSPITADSSGDGQAHA
jgi:hypothetical protein